MSEQRHASLQIHGLHAHEAPSALKRRQILRRARLLALVAVLLLAIGAGRALFDRHSRGQALASVTEQIAQVHVTVTQASVNHNAASLLLPGTLQGIVESPIYARATGYVVRWYKDIGAPVAKGEVLAELDTPEIDQQLSQAIAARDQTAASVTLARSSKERWEALRRKDAVSQQELDERSSAFVQAQANLEAAQANVRRLQQQQAFKRIVAPYAGTITRRNIDVGDLVDAGNAGSARALFMLAQTDRLKTNIYVPQANAQSISIGQPVTIRQSELPGQTFEGRIARTAGAIDTATRTMQAVVHLDNADRRLMPGAYVEVELQTARSERLVVPANTLLFRAEGTRVAVVDANGVIRLQPVVIGRNFGRSIEILSGITPQDRLVVNPPDSLADGDAVTVATPPGKEGA
ncbi:MAG: efflux RND transporter periplasmic adaptor subunit [Burkholderiaceae bacterium]